MNNKDWNRIAENKKMRKNAKNSLEKMHRFLFDYFHLLGPAPMANTSTVVNTLVKILGSTVALYNRKDSGVLKTWCIDHKTASYKRVDSSPFPKMVRISRPLPL